MSRVDKRAGYILSNWRIIRFSVQSQCLGNSIDDGRLTPDAIVTTLSSSRHSGHRRRRHRRYRLRRVCSLSLFLSPPRPTWALVLIFMMPAGGPLVRRAFARLLPHSRIESLHDTRINRTPSAHEAEEVSTSGESVAPVSSDEMRALGESRCRCRLAPSTCACLPCICTSGRRLPHRKPR